MSTVVQEIWNVKCTVRIVYKHIKVRYRQKKQRATGEVFHTNSLLVTGKHIISFVGRAQKGTYECISESVVRTN